MMRKVVLILKTPLPMLIGLILGMSVSLMVTPVLWPDDGDCIASDEGSLFARDTFVHSENVKADKFTFDYGNEDDFKPRIIIPKTPINPPEQTQTKILRPRYASTELGIRDKLFIGVLSSTGTIETMGVAINKTVTHLVPKLVFFMDARGHPVPQGMSVVSFSDDKSHLKPFHMLKYISAHYAQAYDYYMFIPDTTYIKGEKVFELVSQISVSRNVHLGKPVSENDKKWCDFSAGVILSQNMLTRVLENLDWCMKHALYDDISENIGVCFIQALDIPCSSTVHGMHFPTFSAGGFNFDSQITEMDKSPEFQQALSISSLRDDITVYKLHKHFCEKEIEVTKSKIKEAQRQMIRMAPWVPKNDTLTWPLGVPPPVEPTTRFDIIRWNYFTNTHIYLDDDFTNVRELRGSQKDDIDDVIRVSMEKLHEKYGDRFSFHRLLNGYCRFDATRGMEYILDLLVVDSVQKMDIIKRVNLVRPLSKVEIVPMPYVTESTRINLILPVTASTRDGVVSFLDSYAHTCLDSGDNSNLFVVFIYDTDNKNDKDDIFSVLKSMISYYESKYMNGARIVWSAETTSSPSKIALMDSISKKFSAESLFLLCTVGMELSIDYLNRIRMNTIANWQVYFPIGFWQYKPNLVFEEKPYPTVIEISRDTGHFDANAYDHASFYNSDYIAARQRMREAGASVDVGLFKMFLLYHDAHVFRAVEPALLHRYHERICKPTSDEEAYHRCLVSRSEGLASRSQLAMLIFEHYQNINSDMFQAIQKQGNPKVEQMKPNMLRK